MTKTLYITNDVEYFNLRLLLEVGTSVEKILDAKKINIHNPTIFAIYARDCNWDSTLLRGFVDLFDHFKKESILWETFHCDYDIHWGHDDRQNDRLSPNEFIGHLLYLANLSSCFKRFEFLGGAHCRPSGAMMERELILSGITLNERIESIKIHPTYALTNADVRTLNHLLRTTKTLKELEFNEMGANFDNPLLHQCLVDNNTLEKLVLVMGNSRGWLVGEYVISDDTVSRVITSLIGHPTLRELTVCDADGKNRELNQTCNAIRRLLTSSTVLSVLNLEDSWRQKIGGVRSRWNLEHILNGLENSRSLKTLRVRESFDGVLDQILVGSHPSLERVIYEPSIFTSLDLQRVTKVGRRKKPIVLQLNSSVAYGYAKDLREMLHAHPEILLKLTYNRNIAILFNDNELTHYYDFNWHGRYLLDYYPRNNNNNNNNNARGGGGGVVPISIWPLVLANANEKPAIMYEFLKSDAYLDGYVNHLRSESLKSDGYVGECMKYLQNQVFDNDTEVPNNDNHVHDDN